jgi:hypothetical protein
MFQQRHFEAIAQMMQETWPGAMGPGNRAVMQWTTTRDAMCELFARHNPNFMRDRFEAACIPGANVRARGKERAKGSGYSPRGLT